MTVKTSDANEHWQADSQKLVSPAPLPQEYRTQLRWWKGTAIFFHFLAFFLTAAGVIAGVAVAANWKQPAYSAPLGLLAAVSAGLSGVIRPAQIGNRYWNAWRTLFVSSLRYEYEKTSLKSLTDAVAQGETIIGDLDLGTADLKGVLGGKPQQGKGLKRIYNVVVQLHQHTPKDQLLELLRNHPSIAELHRLDQQTLVRILADYVVDSVANGGASWTA